MNKYSATTNLIICALTTIIVGCGGGGGGSDRQPDSSEITEEVIFNGLNQSNLRNRGVYDLGDARVRAAVKDKIKHWHHNPDKGIYVPVKINDTIFVEEALNRIETKLGFQVFDRTSIESLDDEDINYGIIFREGTAVGPDGEPNEYACGNTGAKDGSPRYEDDWQSADGSPQVALSVNIGSSIPTPNCIVDVGLVVHEVMHALGMSVHFEWFGRGDKISHENDIAYTVLYNIYMHDRLTPAENVEILLPYN